MTNDSKLKLLKLITGQPTETPGANVPTYYDLGSNKNNAGDKIEGAYYQYPRFRATPYNTISFKDCLISYNEIVTCIWKPKMELTGIYENSGMAILDICTDGEGIYALINSNGNVYIDYWNDITEPNPEGDYYITTKMRYDITQILQEVTGDTNLQSSAYCGALRLEKSPIDGRFLIFTCTANQSYYSVIEYTINVGSGNTYRYKRIATSSLSTDIPTISDVHVSWTQNNVQYAFGIIGKSSVIQSKANFNIYEIFGTMSAISYNTLKSLTNCVCAPITMRVAHTPQIRYLSFYKKYISYVQIGSSSVTGWNGATIYMIENNNGTERVLSQTTTDYGEKSGATYKNEVNIVIKDTEVIGVESKLTAEDKLTATLKQLIGSTISEHTIVSNVDYDKTTSFSLSAIFQKFNVYDFTFQMDNYAYITRAVFRKDGYNGTSFFGKNSLKAVSGVIYAVAGWPIFARDLYNKSKIGSSINSVLHIPQNFTDPTTDILYTKDLVSETNSVIDEKINELIKDEYEELYLNYIDNYKVIDKNNKTTYMSSATSHIVDEIYNGFSDYLISKYRINYKDGTHKDGSVGEIPIEDGVGKIEFNVGVPSQGIENVEIYDKDYTAPFCSIDMSSYQEGAYHITQYVKVE